MCALMAFHRRYGQCLHLHVRCVQGLRLHDNPALLEGANGAQHMYPIFIIDPHFLRCGTEVCGHAGRAGTQTVQWMTHCGTCLEAKEEGCSLAVFQVQTNSTLRCGLLLQPGCSETVPGTESCRESAHSGPQPASHRRSRIDCELHFSAKRHMYKLILQSMHHAFVLMGGQALLRFFHLATWPQPRDIPSCCTMSS